ncbi:MAG: hypothetical protein ACHQX3_03985 [Nitrospirales bacterium]|jgi:hypothetical protein
MIPTIGRIVHYKLSAADAAEVNRRRTTGPAIAERIAYGSWPLGAQAHIGNEAKEGDFHPMMMVQTWVDGHGVNGQVFLDGNDVLWVTSRVEGTEPGTFSWPVKV